MENDPMGEIDATLAAGLLRINRAAALARHALTRPDKLPPYSRCVAERALKIREAIVSSGIPLPPARAGDSPSPEMQDREEDPLEPKAPQSVPRTLSQIAQLAGVHRTTVARWAYGAGVRHVGLDDPPLTREEVKQILRAGERAALADSLENSVE